MTNNQSPAQLNSHERHSRRRKLALSRAVEGIILWPMKLRLDLLEHLTAEDIRKAAEESVHRFKPEPLLSKTGTGSLSSASIEERAKEVEHSMELTRKLIPFL